MSHRLLLAVVALVIVCFGLLPAQAGPASAQPVEPPRAGAATERIFQLALDWLDGADEKVDRLVPAAELAAERLMNGGTLYVAGNPGFVDEFDYRAGGFPFTVIWSDQRLRSNDVLLVGCYRPNEEKNTRYAELSFLIRGYGRRFGNCMSVHLASHRWPQIGRFAPMVNDRAWGDRLHLIDTDTPRCTSWAALSLGQMATTALAWAFSGEVIAAATRKGKMLATYASDWEPHGREWDASVKGKHVHPKYTVAPIEPGVIGKRYLRICREQIARFAATQPAQVRLGGRRMAECMRRGGVVWIVTNGHIHTRGSVVPAQLTRMLLFGRGYDWWYFSRRMPRGDLLMWMGYLRYPRRQIDAALARGAEAVVVSVDAGPANERVTQVRGCWRDFDTVIDLEGYPIRVLPSSGVVQTPQWYALMAETLAAYEKMPPASPGR